MSDANGTSRPLNFTFGVEIEHIFGIKQDEIRDKEEYAWLRPEKCPLDPGAPAFAFPQEDDLDDLNDEYYMYFHGRREIAGLRQAVKIMRQNAAGGHTIQLRVPAQSDEEVIADEKYDADDHNSRKLTLDRRSNMPKMNEQTQKWSDGKIRDVDG